jgi:hypothetical protein
VAERLGDAGGVLVVDDTGFEKKGRRSAGVQRQYTGTAGKITNCRIGVFCSYVNPGRQRVLIDRELYLPESWFADPGRLADAGVPERARFATKPELAWRMIERAADDPLLVFGWVTGDEAYGDNTALRRPRGELRVRASPATIRSCLAAPAPGPTPLSPAWTGRRGSGSRAGTAPRAAAGTTGHGSAWASTNGCWPAGRSATPPTWRSTDAKPTGRSDCPSWCGWPDPAGASRNVSKPPRTRSAWTTTRSARTPPGTGTSPWPWSPMPTWPSWLRDHPQTQVATATAVARPRTSPHRGPIEQGRSRPGGADWDEPDQLAPLTVNEIRRLHAQLHQPRHPHRHRIRWSRWRRRHQARARRCHYQRQRRLIDH